MIINYLKIALRTLVKYKTFSLINIIGLAVGIACSILIMLFVSYELSYDKFHEKANRIYRVAVRASIGDTKIRQTHSSAATYLKLFEEFPEIETGVKFLNLDQIPVIQEDQVLYENRIFGVDSTFFDVFSAPLLIGDPGSVLSQPNTMVITAETALRYFGETDAVGKMLKVDFGVYGGVMNFEITGVSEKLPDNSHFHYNFLLSNMSFPELINNEGWTSNNFITYLVLAEGSSEELFDEKLKEFTRRHMGGEQFDEWVAEGNSWEYFLQPIQDIHLESDLNGEFEANGNKSYVYIFSVISIFILVIACINFMNLTTANSTLRAKEIGIRKVTGSRRTNLIFQFLGESIILCYLALILGLLLVESLLPSYGNFVGRPLEISYLGNIFNIPALLVFGLILGILAGSYPAFFLSSFKTIDVLKGKSGESRSSLWLRSTLVIFQFSISIFLIIGTMVIYRQLNYLLDKDLGFSKEQVLVLNCPAGMGDNSDAFKETLEQHSNILKVSGSNTLPGKGFSNIGFGAEEVDQGFTLNLCICDYDFAKTLGIKISQGRFFSNEFSDSAAAILNRKAAELAGWDDPIGKRINNWGDNRGDFTVIGVIEDYHYESLHQEIRPQGLFLNGGYYKRDESYISIRFASEETGSVIAYVEDSWETFAPDLPFEYTFLDEDYENLYTNETQTRQLFIIFSILAILIACLGLFGLALFIAGQRIKEIGVRKVMGASVTRIVTLLNLNFLKWIVLAGLIACPLAWFAMKNWLTNFAYRIEIPWTPFVLAVLLALVIAFGILSLQTIRAARKNPVDTLRYE